MRRFHQANAKPREEWETPPGVFDPLDEEFGFTLDACASPENAKCDAFLTAEMDALSRPWPGIVWCNPPYGQRNLAEWVTKAWCEAEKGATVVLLVPARTDAAWFHDYALRGEVRFIRRRIRFVGAPYNAPFPSCVVVFKGVDR